MDAGRTDVATIVCLQAGNVHSGAYDPFDEAIAIAHGMEPGCTWTGPSGCGRRPAHPTVRWLAGPTADSWATDAHKTLNVPYDNGIAIVPTRHRCMRPWASTPPT